ncbi:MAG: Ig-like domain repeat protein, partial [Methanobrevibacter sp.]|nr:Ig-like domain repeat protein [Methanobrevibacter sp.]
PVTPGKLGLGTHVFSNSAIEVFKLLSPLKSYMVGEKVELNYQVNYISKSSPVVRFAIPEGFDFNTATLSKGTFTYDASPRVVTWYLNDCDSKNFITLSLKAVKSGQFNLAYSLNNKFVNEIKLNVNEYGVLISASDVNKYYKGPERFNVYLKDITNCPIAGESVVISINGQTYTRQTNDNGIASIALNLNSGNYTASASYDGRFGKNSTTANVNVLHTISGNDIIKMYRNDTQYYAKFVDASGNPLVNTAVSFNINGVFYTRNTDANGQAKLNINLNPGDYILTTINSNNGEQHSNNVKVLPILVDGHDITKYYRNDSAYSVKVLDNVGNPLANADVKFNINGVFYTRTTNESGYANLNLRLQPGSYVVTAEYNSLKYTNIVTILPVLFADDAVSHTNATNFKARLIDGQGKPYANQSIDFNINGVIYTNVTDSEGIANLIVNLADGEYIVTSSYDEYNINNKITVKNEA